jgi:hypothetical protein
MVTDRRLANLRPWGKGQSGNPSGRLKIPPDVKEMARGLATLAAVMRDATTPHSNRDPSSNSAGSTPQMRRP